jgi:pimeloyl-ACP methyl ester carboxylesterase
MTDLPTADAGRILTREGGGAIAYHRSPGHPPGIVFLGGFKSDMTGGKAMWLDAFCKARGQAFLRFDYSGHGASSGRFVDGTIGQWASDAVAALDALTEGPQILIGSSMGGWLMLLTALARPRRVCGLVGIAPAPDFTEDLIESRLTPEQKAVLDRDGVVQTLTEWSPEPTPITRRLLDEGRNHLLLRGRIPLTVPVRLIHGTADRDVPCETSLRLATALDSEDVEITLVKGAGHRLSEPNDLKRLAWTLGALIERLKE